MNELIIMHDRQAVTTSLKVAESFGKNHRDVLAAIRDLMSSAENYAVLKKYFIDGSYTASNGKTNPMYYMNRDGFTLLAVDSLGSVRFSSRFSTSKPLTVWKRRSERVMQSREVMPRH